VCAWFTVKEMNVDDNCHSDANCLCVQCVSQLHSCAAQGDVDGILNALKGIKASSYEPSCKKLRNNV